MDFVQGAQGGLTGRGLSRPEVLPGTMFQAEGTTSMCKGPEVGCARV